MTEAPPSRWKVIERGRRLEVVDTHAAGAQAPQRGTVKRPGLPTRLRFDGTLGWTTHPFYDDRAPRAVVLDGGLARWIGGAIAMVAVVLVLVGVVAGTDALPLVGAVAAIVASSWKQVRPWLTRRLDAIAAP